MRIILALAWSLGRIGNEANELSPDCSKFKSPIIKTRGIKIQRDRMIPQSIIILYVVVTSRVIGIDIIISISTGHTIGIIKNMND
jgi:hypothetical protein